jgi:hypothetical protein
VPITGGLILELVEESAEASEASTPKGERPAGWHPLNARAPSRSAEGPAVKRVAKRAATRKQPAKRRRRPGKPRG